MCDHAGHHYTVEDEAQRTVLYAGQDRDTAIAVHVAYRQEGGCGYITAGHPGGPYCSEESSLTEDEAIKAWDEQAQKWRDAYEAFHGEGPYAIADQD